MWNMTPGSDSLPNIVNVFPAPVAPYANTVEHKMSHWPLVISLTSGHSQSNTEQVTILDLQL